MALDLRSTLDHPAWRTLGGTLAGYLLLLGVMTTLLFVVPFLVFGSL